MMNRRQTGLSLVELMVGLTLGLLLVGIAVSIYLSGRQTSRVVDTVGRLEESARFAVEAMEQDIRMTGFRGCNGMANSPVNTLNSPGSFNNRFDQTLFGYHGSGSTWTPALDTSISSLPQPPIAGTDVIAIKRTYDNGAALTAQMTGTTGAVTVEASAPFAQGDYILVSDCEAQAVFQATQVTSSPTTGSLSHAAVAVPTPGNASADLTHVFNTDASAYRVVTKTYFVAQSARNKAVHSLWSYSVPDYTGAGQPQELVDGVDNLVLLYGEDTDNDQAANRYVTADNVGTWNNVVSVRIQLLMASVQNSVSPIAQTYTFNGASATAADRRIRSVFTSVITLRNRVM